MLKKISISVIVRDLKIHFKDLFSANCPNPHFLTMSESDLFFFINRQLLDLTFF